MASRLLITPEAYSGEGPFDAWTDHFKKVSTLNKWDDKEQVQWPLVGYAQLTVKHLSLEDKPSCKLAKEALTKQFEPECKCGYYAAEFRACLKQSSEDWATYGEDLKALVEKAFPDLYDAAQDHLAVNHFLAKLMDPQVAFNVRQTKPKTLDEVVTATLDVQSHLQLANCTMTLAAP